MKRYGQWVLSLLFIVLVVEIIIISPKEVGPGEESMGATVGMDDQQAEQKMSGFHLIEMRDENKEWELWSDTATGYKEKGIWILDNVKAVFFAKKGGHFTVTGEKGEVNVETKDMLVEGNVVTLSSNGYVFNTQKLIYEWENRRLKGPLPVTMKSPVDPEGGVMKLQGQSVNADLSTSLISISGDVKGYKTFKDSKKLLITSNDAEFSGRSRYAKFKGDVIMDLNTMRITGPEAKFIYDSEKNLVKSVAVTGGVKVSDMEKWATSNQVDVFFADDRYEFKGRPRVVQNNDELVGEKIIFLEGGKIVQVKKARARVDPNSTRTVN